MTPSSATPAPQSFMSRRNRNKSRFTLTDQDQSSPISNAATMLIHQDTSTYHEQTEDNNTSTTYPVYFHNI